MPKHDLSPSWTKIASAGENAAILNSGLSDIIISRAGGKLKLPPGGSANYSGLRADVFASSEGAKAEVVTTITPGLPSE